MTSGTPPAPGIRERPASPAEAAAVMGRCGAEGQRVRIRGGATKNDWGRSTPPPEVEVDTGGLDRLNEYNAADLTAVLGAGMSFAAAQAVFAEKGQRLALDPPLGAGDGATIGGVMATADSGPLRHRHGAVRDLVLGVTVALSDGTLARAGGKVIKNVAGYDLGKLFAGSFGTLGLIVEVALRLHPCPTRTATVVGRGDDPAVLTRGCRALTHAPLEADCLDVAWENGSGAVLARFANERVGDALTLLAGSGLDLEVAEDDADLWADQQAGQRSADGVVVKVSALPSALPEVLRTAEALSGVVVGRAGLGLSWVRLPAAPTEDQVASVEDLRRRLAPAPCVVLDAPAAVREKLDPWGEETGPVALMQRVKARFDPAGVCNPGVFVSGI